MLDFAHHWTTRGAVTKQVILDAFRAIVPEEVGTEDADETDEADEGNGASEADAAGEGTEPGPVSETED
jgi:hypothetical protein